MAKKKKPFDPAQAERHRREREAEAAEIDRLTAQPNVAVNVDKRTGRLTGAWRINCFNTVLKAGSPSKTAVDWLDETIRTAAGENGGERRPDFIRASVEGAPGQNVSDLMIQAGRDLEIIEHYTSPRDVQMLYALLQPDADHDAKWQATVERLTGEKDPRSQAARVRAACAHLAWVKDRMPSLRRDYAMRKQMAA